VRGVAGRAVGRDNDSAIDLSDDLAPAADTAVARCIAVAAAPGNSAAKAAESYAAGLHNSADHGIDNRAAAVDIHALVWIDSAAVDNHVPVWIDSAAATEAGCIWAVADETPDGLAASGQVPGARGAGLVRCGGFAQSTAWQPRPAS